MVRSMSMSLASRHQKLAYLSNLALHKRKNNYHNQRQQDFSNLTLTEVQQTSDNLLQTQARFLACCW